MAIEVGLYTANRDAQSLMVDADEAFEKLVDENSIQLIIDEAEKELTEIAKKLDAMDEKKVNNLLTETWQAILAQRAKAA